VGFGNTTRKLDDLTDVSVAAPEDGQVLTFNAGTGQFEPVAPSGGGGGLTAVVDDPAPQLGGDLHCDGYNVTYCNAIECTNGDGAASLDGAAVFGYFGHGGGTEQIAANAKGSLASGKVQASSYIANLGAAGYGAFVHGYATDADSANAQVLATGIGSTAFGYCEQSLIQALSAGALAGGAAYGGDAIYASGAGSLAFGRTNNKDIGATAQNAFQFGPGVNNQAGSLAVGNQAGSAVMRLRPGHSYSGGESNGDVWLEDGSLWFMLNNSAYYVLGNIYVPI